MPELSKEEKVFNLVVELAETERQKKASAAGFRDEIKRIKAEIKELLDGQEETEAAD